MTKQTNWADLLTSWQSEAKLLVSLIPDSIVDEKDKPEQLPTDLLRGPATDFEIAAAHEKIGGSLPRDLIDFYSSSNGWHQLAFDEYDLDIVPVGSVKRLAEVDSSLKASIADYATEADDGRNFFRREELDNVVLLSDHRSGCYLVNVSGLNAGQCCVVRWKSSPQLFGSFYDLMESERQRCLNSLREMLG
jgi:hypothetical protein